METSSNGSRPQSTGQAFGGEAHGKKSKHGKMGWFSLKTVWAIFFVCLGILVIALLVYLATNTFKSEGSYVDKNEYQAVFVNVQGSSGGQAYFGHIQAVNPQYIELSNVFYLEPGSTSNQFTLNNLSCALYNPQDTMVINRSQVAFWENLKSNSQVTSDINKWYTDNLQCSSTTTK